VKALKHGGALGANTFFIEQSEDFFFAQTA
jgi:hypothetical protein